VEPLSGIPALTIIFHIFFSSAPRLSPQNPQDTRHILTKPRSVTIHVIDISHKPEAPGIGARISYEPLAFSAKQNLGVSGREPATERENSGSWWRPHSFVLVSVSADKCPVN